MSTKIYNGVIFFNTDFHLLVEKLKELKPILLATGKDQYFKLLFSQAVRAYDLDVFRGNPIKNKYLRESHDNILKIQKEIETTNRRNPQYDFSFSLSIIPIKNKSKKILGIFYTENNVLKEVFLDQPYVMPYEYYNNTDRPNSVTKKEWMMREKDWGIAFEKSSCPADVGVNYEFIPTISGTFFEIDQASTNEKELNNYIPSLKKRLTFISNRIADIEYAKIEPPPTGTRGWFSYLEKIREYGILHKERLNELAKEICKKDLTISDLEKDKYYFLGEK